MLSPLQAALSGNDKACVLFSIMLLAPLVHLSAAYIYCSVYCNMLYVLPVHMQELQHFDCTGIAALLAPCNTQHDSALAWEICVPSIILAMP